MILKKITAIILTLCMFVGGINSVTFAQNNTNDVTAGKKVNDSNSWDGVTKEKTFNGDGFKVIYKLQSTWTGGYNASVVIENTGIDTIENWTLGFDYNGGISNVWNAELEIIEKGKYIVKNAGWNQDIEVGKSVEFGINGNGDFAGFPQNYNLCGELELLDKKDYEIKYRINNEWDSGFNAEIEIINNTNHCMEDWVLEFDYNREITSIWNGVIKSHNNNHYVIKNCNYNSIIELGKSVVIGFSAKNGSNVDCPYNIKMFSYEECEKNEAKREKEPLESIGEAYVKYPQKEDIRFDEETGLQYVNNQLLISAFIGTDKRIVEQIIDEVGAKIVGYIELTNDYQIEFFEPKSLSEMEVIAEYINSFHFISAATLNMAFMEKCELVETNDSLYNDGQTCLYSASLGETTFGDVPDDWNETNPKGDNWGLEALKIPSAWELKDSFNPVKIGIYDNCFDTEHEDLLFDDVCNNITDCSIDHGTNVAGIIAAQHNNAIGISGVTTDPRLYGYAFVGNDYGSSMGDKLAYATLIGNHVKVINVSVGGSNATIFAASHPEIDEGNSKKAANNVKESAKVLEEYLKKLLVAGYDFVICTSAGNTNGYVFVRDDEADYGIREATKEEIGDSDISKYSGGALAKYDCALTAIEDNNVKNHIIVVGSIGSDYSVSDFSNIGDRVDFVAPGENILSTVPDDEGFGYAIKSGTSMASPQIAGLVAMMYQYNPAMSGALVKPFISLSNAIEIEDGEYKYILPDAVGSCENAKKGIKPINNDIDIPMGIVCGNTKSADDDSSVDKVEITAIRIDTGINNMESFNEFCYYFKSDDSGYYMNSLPQGTYDFLIYKDGYIPYVFNDVEILANETIYMEPVMLISDFMYSIYGSAVQGNVKDALDGSNLENVKIKLRKGWNNKSGDYVKNFFGYEKESDTDLDGRFSLEVSCGAYTAELSKDGYITGFFNVISGYNGLTDELTNVDMILTPKLSDDEYRIVLTWGSEPRDLDSHITVLKDNELKTHIFYSYKKWNDDNEQVIGLDLDDTSSFGPETITLKLKSDLENDGAIYRYSVHNYSSKDEIDDNSLSLSGAVVRVYAGNNNIATYNVPMNVEGNVWHVFDITKSGLKLVNEFYNESDPRKVK